MDLQAENIKALQDATRIIARLEKELNQSRSTWAEPEEACEILGFFGATAHRKLGILIKLKHIKKYKPGRPNIYDKRELRELAEKFRTGDIIL